MTKEEELLLIVKSGSIKKEDLNQEMINLAAAVMQVDPLTFLNNPELNKAANRGNELKIRLLVYLFVLLGIYAKDSDRSEVVSKLKYIKLASRNKGSWTLHLDPGTLDCIDFNAFKEIKHSPQAVIQLLDKNKYFNDLKLDTVCDYLKAEDLLFQVNDSANPYVSQVSNRM